MIMKNKRGQLMDVFLVFTTVVFCSIVMVLYLQSQTALTASLVSPVGVLELNDRQMQFEQEEYVALKGIYCGSEDDSEVMKEKFCSEFNGFLNRDFLLDDNFPLAGMKGITSGNLCDKVYTFSDDDGDLTVVRGGLGKRKLLKAPSDKGIKFDVLLEMVLAKEYLLTEANCE